MRRLRVDVPILRFCYTSRVSAADQFTGRLHRVVDYIDDHLAEPLTLEELAGVAAFSKYHFHRLFAAEQGETLFRYIRRLRLERAASAMLAHRDRTVLEVALECGFENASAFSRAFREHFGVPATEWRRRGGIAGEGADALSERCGDSTAGPRNGASAWADSWRRHPVTRSAEGRSIVWVSATDDGRRRTVRIENLEPTEIAYVRNVGPYQANAKLFERLFDELSAWATPRGLLQGADTVYSLCHDTPEITPDEKLRVSVAIPVPADTVASGRVGRGCIAGGTYAVATMDLGPLEYGEAWSWVYGYWLPTSGYEPDDRVAFERYASSAVADPVTGRAPVDICVPVRPAR